MQKINLEQKLLSVKGEVLKNVENKEMKIRDCFLIMLGARFPIQDKKEVFWTTQLGILCADEKNKEIDISDDKMKFLKRIFENNRIKRQLPTGQEEEMELFLPFELGQILQALGVEEE